MRVAYEASDLRRYSLSSSSSPDGAKDGRVMRSPARGRWLSRRHVAHSEHGTNPEALERAWRDAHAERFLDVVAARQIEPRHPMLVEVRHALTDRLLPRKGHITCTPACVYSRQEWNVINSN